MTNKSRLKKILLWIIASISGIGIIAAIALYFFVYLPFTELKDEARQTRPVFSETSDTAESVKYKQDFWNAVKPDTNGPEIRMSHPNPAAVPFMTDQYAGQNVRRVYNGRRVNIAVIGVDSRMGQRFKHADANHVISILLDSGTVEITSIPRDTPVDCGYPDSTNNNKLTVFYALNSKDQYLDSVAKIAGLDKVHYYIEVGFSQTMGVLELLGFKNSGKALKVLRARKGIYGADFQRAYNQAQFIRLVMLRHFRDISGFWSEVILRGGLGMLNTNMKIADAKRIIDKLKKVGFPRDSSKVSIRIRPPMKIRYRAYNLLSEEVVVNLDRQINEKLSDSDTLATDTTDPGALKLHAAIVKARGDSNRIGTLVHDLKPYFDQRAWLQVRNRELRQSLRKELCDLLKYAYRQRGNSSKIKYIDKVIREEDRLFNSNVFRK